MVENCPPAEQKGPTTITPITDTSHS